MPWNESGRLEDSQNGARRQLRCRGPAPVDRNLAPFSTSPSTRMRLPCRARLRCTVAGPIRVRRNPLRLCSQWKGWKSCSFSFRSKPVRRPARSLRSRSQPRRAAFNARRVVVPCALPDVPHQVVEGNAHASLVRLCCGQAGEAELNAPAQPASDPRPTPPVRSGIRLLVCTNRITHTYIGAPHLSGNSGHRCRAAAPSAQPHSASPGRPPYS